MNFANDFRPRTIIIAQDGTLSLRFLIMRMSVLLITRTRLFSGNIEILRAHTHVRTERECSQPSHRHVFPSEGSGEHQVRRQMAGHATSGFETPQAGARDAGRVAEPVLVSFKENASPMVFVCAHIVK